MTDSRWMLDLIQVSSSSSFPIHNIGSAQLKLLFEKTGGTVPLALFLIHSLMSPLMSRLFIPERR